MICQDFIQNFKGGFVITDEIISSTGFQQADNGKYKGPGAEIKG